MAVLDPGDEAVIPAPYWVSYPDMVLLADGLPVTPNCPASQGYKLTPRQLEAAITPKTRLLLINSPVQSDRRRVHARRVACAGRRAAAAPARHRRHRRHVREDLVGQRAVLQPAHRRARALRPRRHHQRRVEVLCHDGLAPGLLRWTEGNRERHVHDPGPEHEQRLAASRRRPRSPRSTATRSRSRP